MFRLWSHITSPLYAQGTPGVQAGALLLSLTDIELSTREKASGEALAVDMGIPISLVWQLHQIGQFEACHVFRPDWRR
jgi:hypothetical protein